MAQKQRFAEDVQALREQLKFETAYREFTDEQHVREALERWPQLAQLRQRAGLDDVDA